MAILPKTGLETHPTGTINIGGIINGNWSIIEALFNPELDSDEGQYGAVWEALAGQSGMTTIAYSASVNLDLSSATREICQITLAGALTVAVTNKAAGRHRWLVIRGDGSNRNLTWPAGAVWAGGALTSVASGTVALVLILSTGTANSDLLLSAFKIPAYSDMGIVPKAYGGSGQDNSSLTFPASGTLATIADLTGAAGATPSWEDQDIPAQVTASDEDPAVDAGDWNAFTETPAGRVDVLISQSRFATVGNGAKNRDCYFSADGGTTALAHAAIATATSLHWMGSIAGYQLTATDTVSLKYAS